jgi:hypothetical protein
VPLLFSSFSGSFLSSLVLLGCGGGVGFAVGSSSVVIDVVLWWFSRCFVHRIWLTMVVFVVALVVVVRCVAVGLACTVAITSTYGHGSLLLLEENPQMVCSACLACCEDTTIYGYG